MNPTDKPSYVLITAARNEEAYIEKTLAAVVSQTVLPQKWVIVSDGSTDRTDEIVSEYAKKYNFIQLVRAEDQRGRDFASKVYAVDLGYEQLKNCDYDYLGNLDADVSFDSNFYETVLTRFEQNSNLGIVGGFIYEKENGEFRSLSYNSNEDVAGATQTFRRACYEAIEGYRPLKWGGEDSVANTMALMKGWEVQSFADLKVFHYRPMGRGGGRLILRFRFNEGLRDYSVGYSPVYFLMKAIRRTFEKPYILGSLARLVGYSWAVFRRYKRGVPRPFINFMKHEQMKKLKLLVCLFQKDLNNPIV